MKIKVTKEELDQEKEGVRVEVQNPSPTTPDEEKKDFGVEINLDKPGAQRTYNGYSVTDSQRGAPVNPRQGGFLAPGSVLPTNREDEVTLQPDDSNATIKTGRQLQIDIEASKDDIDKINNVETGKTTIAWQGKYGTDNPKAKMFDGSNFGVTVGVNPYPNENRNLDLIKIDGNTTVDKVPVKNQYVVSKARISNLTSSFIDPATYEEVNIDESGRITGVVLHPREDIVVEGAEAILVTNKNIDDMKAKTGNTNLEAGQIVFKMPKGALQDENSIFNDNKFQGLQNLRAKFFARPRTKEEFTTLAESLRGYEGDESFGYSSTGAGTETITHNGEEVTIDKQGIDRYDHYNLIGEMTINLDDTKYYDQNFKDPEGKDTAKHTSTGVHPGKSSTIEIYTPDTPSDFQKTAEDMDKAKREGLSIGKVNQDFVLTENKKIAKELGKSVDELKDGEKWKIDLEEGEQGKFIVTAPKTAKAGDFIAVPVEYKYTNGSKDVHWFHFVVQDSDNNKPEYHAEVGYQGDKLTQTPEIPTGNKKLNPVSFELIPNENGEYKYKDDRGNIWSDIKIDSKTGQITATVPEDVEIVGGENVFIPVKANYVDPETGEKKEETVKAQFIARPKYKTTVTDTDEKEVAFETKEVLDENLDVGEIEIVNPGKVGKKKTIFEQDVVNGKKGLIDPETGEFTEGDALFRKVEVTIEEKEDRLVKVGVRPVEKIVETNFPTEVLVDDSLASGETITDQEGQSGEVLVTTKRDPETGKISTEISDKKAPVAKKIRVGAKTTGTVVDTDEIPFEYEITEDPNLSKGEYVVDVKGAPGSITKTWDIVNSQIVGDPKVEKVEPVKAKIRVGNKDFTGNIAHEVTEKVPFEVEVIEDENLKCGTIQVDQAGKPGSKTTIYSQDIKNGSAEGELKSKEDETRAVAPIKHIVRVGKKAPEAENVKEVESEVGVDIEYVYDNTLDVTIAKPGEYIAGSVKTVVKNVFNPETGEIKSVEETVVTKPKQQIIVGTKKFNGELTNKVTRPIRHTYEIEVDPSLKAGEIVTDKVGEDGVETITITQNFENGEEKSVNESSETTKEPVNGLIRVGSLTDGTYEYIEEIPFKVEVKKNPKLKKGEYNIVQKGEPGSKTTSLTIKNSKVLEDQTSVNTTKNPVNEIIEVGEEDFTGSFETVDKDQVPFETEYQIDPTMDSNADPVVVQKGELGEQETTNTHTVINGEVTKSDKGETKQTKAPQKQIVRIGAKTNGEYKVTEDIPFKVEVKKDPSLKKGEWKYEQDENGKDKSGVVGSQEKTLTIVNSNVTETSQPNITKSAENAVILVGDEDFTGEVSHTERQKTPFEVEVIEDPELLIGTTKVEQEGEAGVVNTKYTQAIKNGKADGDMETRVLSEKKPKKHIIRVGTKPVEGTQTDINKLIENVEVEYIIDETLAKGTVENAGVEEGKVETKLVSKIVDGKVVNTEETIITPPKQKIRIGAKDFTGEYKYSQTCPIPYPVEVIENPNLEAGKSNIKQEGKAGSKNTNFTQAIKNGQAEGAPIVEEGDETKPITHIIEVGTKPAENQTSVKRDVPVDIEYIYDNTKPAGKAENGKFTPGKVETVVTNKYNPETGKIESKEDTAVTNAKQQVIIGTHKYTGTLTHDIEEDIPYKTEVEFDSNLEHGEMITDQQGQNGRKTIKIVQNFEDGNKTTASRKEKITTQPTTKKVRVGTRTEGTHDYKEEIPFEVEVRKVKDLKKGESRVAQQGEPGEKTTTVTIENSKVKGEPTSKVTKEPTKHIIEVGNEDFTGEIIHENTCPKAFETKYEYDDSIEFGKKVVVQEGKEGSVITESRYNIKNGNQDGEPTRKTKETEPEERIIKIGTKPIVREVEVKYDYKTKINPDLKPGEERVIQEGENGKVTITTFFNKETGQIEVDKKITDPKDRIVEIGSKDDLRIIKEKIPYEIKVIKDDSLEAGKLVVDQEGVYGEKQTIISIKDSEITKSESVEKQPVEKIVRVGSKCENICPLPEDPNKAEEENPDTPSKVDPDESGNEDPGEDTPENPSPENPLDPDTPGIDEPENPGEETPGKDDPIPENPETPEPGKPGEEIPSEPGKPSEETPSDPGTEEPGTPGEETPSRPDTEEPGRPGVKDPAKPGQDEPSQPSDPVGPSETSDKDPTTKDENSSITPEKEDDRRDEISKRYYDKDELVIRRDGKKVSRRSTNPKTGVGSSAGLLGGLGMSIAGLFATKKKKEEDK